MILPLNWSAVAPDDKWLRLSRVGNTVTVLVYSDEYTTLVDTLVITATSTKYKHFVPFASWDSAGADTISTTTGSNKLFIANSNTTTPLIYGEFDNNFVAITDSLGINIGAVDPSHNLKVYGTSWFGGAANYCEIEADGTIHFVGDATVWDDLQVGISNIRIPASNAPTERFYDHGVAAGITFPVLGFAVDDYMYFDVQTAHSMKLSTILDNHIHFCTPTDGTGDKFQFQLDVIAAGIDGTWAVPAGSPFTTELSMTGDFSDVHKLLEIADIPASNTTLSSIYKCKFTRIDATDNEYAGEIYVEFTDCHYEKDTLGSRQELVK